MFSGRGCGEEELLRDRGTEEGKPNVIEEETAEKRAKSQGQRAPGEEVL